VAELAQNSSWGRKERQGRRLVGRPRVAGSLPTACIDGGWRRGSAVAEHCGSGRRRGTAHTGNGWRRGGLEREAEALWRWAVPVIGSPASLRPTFPIPPIPPSKQPPTCAWAGAAQLRAGRPGRLWPGWLQLHATTLQRRQPAPAAGGRLRKCGGRRCRCEREVGGSR